MNYQGSNMKWCGDDIVEELIYSLGRNIRTNGKINDNDLCLVHDMFADVAESALELLNEKDGNQVNIFKVSPILNGDSYSAGKAPSLHLVRGEGTVCLPSGNSGKQCMGYLCFVNSNFCQCPFYEFNVLSGKSICCKHVLAAFLSEALGQSEECLVEQRKYLGYMVDRG
eukprot:Nk52_evm8s279 gene=Nk52_evmTU8s279